MVLPWNSSILDEHLTITRAQVETILDFVAASANPVFPGKGRH